MDPLDSKTPAAGAQETTPAATPAAGTPPAVTPRDAAAGGGQNLIIPQGQMRQRLERAQEKGKKAAMDELEQMAKEAGYASLKDAFKALATAGKTPAAPAGKPAASSTTQAAPAADPNHRPSRRERRDQERAQRASDRTSREVEQLRKQKEQTDKELKRAQKALDAKDAELALRDAAWNAGIRDGRKVKIALELLKDHVAGLDPDKLKEFDEAKFYDELKKGEPWLFQEATRPVTTTPATAPGAGAPPATAQQIQAAQTNSGDLDAMKMKRDEFETLVRQRYGYSPASA